MQTTNNRLATMREAKEIVDELEDELEEAIGFERHMEDAMGRAAAEWSDPRIERIKGDIKSAGGSIRSAGFERHMEDAMGRAAGVAIANDRDLLAERATRLLDEDIELSSEPVATIEATTDDRGRVTLGSEYGDREVTVAVLSAEVPGDGTEGDA